MRITVGISTWNRAKLLDMTLSEMMKLRIPDGVSWELLVVDNNSTDNTSAVISRYMNKLPLRGLFEPRQGKSYACNRLIQEAAGDLVLWTDDDVLVDPEWLANYCEAAARWPDAAFFGGTIEPLFECQPPSWVVDNRIPVFGILALLLLGPDVRPLTKDEKPFGANMAMKIETLRSTSFDCRLGPNGPRPFKGEDTRLIDQLKERGELGIWVGTAKVRHWVPKERMTYKYIWNWHFSEGASSVCLEKVPGKLVCGMPRWVIRRYLEGILSWFCARLRRDSSRKLSGLRKWAFNAGVLSECRRQSKVSDSNLR